MENRQFIMLLLIAAPLFTPQAWADKPIAPVFIEGATSLSAEEVVQLILTEPRLVVIDSRKEEEYAKGHIEGAISLLDTDMDEEALATTVNGKETPLLFYCNGIRCLRSSNATQKALEWGYSNLYWFRGGWLEWQDKRLPMAR
jgi:rhodanese-related sulfurtransferase